MSADAWRICPKCTKLSETKREKAIEKIKKLYGKGDPEVYVDAFNHANKEVELSETLREDYEIRTDEEGEFCITYSCSCHVCNFSYNFNHKLNILEGDNNAK